MTKEELNYQIGSLMGQMIVKTHLPTLSTDILQTRNVIRVSDELTKKWRKLEMHWLDTTKGNSNTGDKKIFEENLKWYKQNIEDKYLEKEITIETIYFEYDEKYIEDVKIAIDNVLWDCDLSHYKLKSLDKFKITLTKA